MGTYPMANFVVAAGDGNFVADGFHSAFYAASALVGGVACTYLVVVKHIFIAHRQG